jgi:RNA polymerase sigma factor (sigma-70 family)
VSATQTRDHELTSEAFERLLRWLDADREKAGDKYETIRARLIKLFVCRGCQIADELADETINRVVIRLQDIAATYKGDPAFYFHGVARLVYLEYTRRKRPSVPLTDRAYPVEDDRKDDARCECLARCLERLTPRSRRLIEAYYSDDGQESDRRRELAEELGVQPNALWVRAHRIREKLRGCVSRCMARKGAACKRIIRTKEL